MHDDDGVGQRPERADRHRPVVRVRTEDVVGVAVATVDHLVEDRAVEGEDRAHASFASWVWVILAMAPRGMGSQVGRLRAS